MIEGWLYAHRHRNRTVQVGDILKLGNIVEPRKNNGFQFRNHDVRVGWDVKLPWEQVDSAIDSLVKNTPPIGSMTEDECVRWFKTYEDIHPFGDGNGRSGSLLYNWLRGTLPVPIHSPNLWDDTRRSYAEYPEPIL